MAKEKKVEVERDEFIVLFTALAMILLAFFIMLVAISSPNDNKKVKIQRALSGNFGTLQGGDNITNKNGGFILNLPSITKNNSEMLFLLKQLEGYVIQNNYGDLVTLYEKEKAIVFSIRDELIFPPGQAKLSKRVLPILKKIAEVIKSSRQYIYVEGHTDNMPIQSKRFPTNWELSASRAVNTVLYLTKQGVNPEKMAAAGFADTKPIFGNKTPSARAMNRRIEIVLLPSKI